MMDATDAPREPTEVGLESGDGVLAESPDSAVDGKPDWEGPDWEEAEGKDCSSMRHRRGGG